MERVVNIKREVESEMERDRKGCRIREREIG
jgi:hypothetical protein